MSASRYVGRVGGLAAALGVGVAVFAGAGAAWADGVDAAQNSPTRTGSKADPATRDHRASGVAGASRVQRTSSRPAAATAPTASSSAPARATASEAVRGMASAVASVGGGSGPAAKATTQSFTSNGLTVTPTVSIADGIIQGSLGATSERGATLDYSVVDSSAGAKLALGTGPAATPTAQDFTVLPYATWLDAGSVTPSGTQTVEVRVSEATQFDQFVTSVPLVGMVAGPVIELLQKLPLISTLLAPIIGASLVATVSVDVGGLSAGRPVAYTYDVTSFDGTEISTNWFPSVSVAAAAVGSAQSPTIFNGPGIATPGQTDPYAEWGIGNQTLGVGTLRNAVLSTFGPDPGTGYNVVTWDPRGEFASGGQLQLDNPFFEGRDVSAIITWLADPLVNPSTLLNGRGDPAVGMVGGSYGGGIQMNVAGTDPRIDGIVPDIAWNSINDSIYPYDVGRTAYTALLALGLITSGARINPQIYEAVITGILFGWLSERSQAFIAGAGVTSMLNQSQAPMLLTQGTVDAIFPLQQSLANVQTLTNNPYGTPTSVVWFCGGHGVCADFTSSSTAGVAQAALLKTSALAWLDQYVNPVQGADAADALPYFQWVDQLGTINNSGFAFDTALPYQAGFNNLPNITGTGAGGLLGILPFSIGGSGPGAGSLPYSAGNGSPAAIGLTVDVTVPPGTQVVGAPTVSFTYSGLGTARAVFAQVIDKSTGRVLGNQVSPIPVTLDGQQHTVSVPIADIAYTYGGDTDPGQLAIQITGSATAFWNSAWGAVNISNIAVTLPNRTPTTS